VHFSRLSIAAVAAVSAAIAVTALLFSGCPALGTTTGLIDEALGSEELLLGCCKGEACFAIRTCESFIREAHG
jgi:hypothetical protein